MYGELFQPEISNLEVQVIGVEWEIYDGIDIALLSYDYEQQKPADEMRDFILELDPSGMSRDLGSELDLVLSVQAYEGLELRLVYAEFEAGKAYDDGTPEGDFDGDTARYVSFELGYEF